MTVTTAIRVTNRYSIASMGVYVTGFTGSISSRVTVTPQEPRATPRFLGPRVCGTDRDRARACLCPGGSPRHRGSSKRSPCPAHPPPARPKSARRSRCGPGRPARAAPPPRPSGVQNAGARPTGRPETASRPPVSRAEPKTGRRESSRTPWPRKTSATLRTPRQSHRESPR